jgi:hypothetical protein
VLTVERASGGTLQQHQQFSTALMLDASQKRLLRDL